MKNIAFGLLMVIFVSFIIQPLVEIAYVMREKIALGSALLNSCRAANISLKEEQLRELNTEIDPGVFRDNFVVSFEKAMNGTRTSTIGNRMIFVSNEERYEKITVELDLTTETDIYLNRENTQVKATAEMEYSFKTKYLKFASEAGETDYSIISERILLLKVTN